MIKIACAGDNCVDYYDNTGESFPGGNPVNVSVYVRRLGGQSAYLGAVGTDDFGKQMCAALQEKGVDVSHVQILPGKTAFSHVERINGERVFGDYDEGVMADFKLDEEDIEEVYEVEKNINFLNHAITDYLVKINQTTLPIEDLKSLGALFHVVNDIERIGDHAENIADAAKQRKEDGISFSKDAQKELGEMLDMVNKLIQYSVDMFVKGDETHMKDVITLEDNVDAMEKLLQKKHVERLTKGECTPEAGMIFSDIASGLERVADHATNIAFAIVDAEKEAEASEA